MIARARQVLATTTLFGRVVFERAWCWRSSALRVVLRPMVEFAMIKIDCDDDVRSEALEFSLSGSSSNLAMRGTPFGQPTLPPEIGGHRIA